MSATKATTAAPKAAKSAFAPVASDCAYPLELFRQITGLDEWALRQARRNGLRMATIGRRKYIIGADFIRYLNGLNPTENSDRGLSIRQA